MSTHFLTAPLAQAIGWALLHLLWQGTIVAGILAAALALLQQKSANVRYAAACAALALLPLLAVATAWRCYEPVAAPSERPLSLRADSLPTDVAKAVVVHATKEAIISAGDLARAALPTVVMIWLAGVTILSIRLFVGLTRVRRMAANATTASLSWERTLRRLRQQLRLPYAVALLQSAAVEVPTVVGWLRPAILLPVSALSGLSADQIEMLLAHELAHIRRNDFFVNVLQSVVETLMFYHPAVWWISNRIRVEREHCCDDLAVETCGNPVQYARALTRLEELRASRNGLVVAANGGSLVRRIRRLVGAPVDDAAAASRWFAGIGILAIIALVFSAPTLPLHAQHEKAAAKKAARPAAAVTPAAPAAAVQTPAVVVAQPKVVAIEVDDDLDADELPVPEPPQVPELDSLAIVAPAIAPVAVSVAVPSAPLAPMALPSIAPRLAYAPRAVVDVVAPVAPAAPPRPPRARRERKHLEFGTSGQLTVDELIELRSIGVTPEYIAEMRGAGFEKATLGEIATLAANRVRAADVRALRAAGMEIATADDAAGLRALRVTPEYVRQMREAGFPNLTRDDVMELRALGVTPEYVAEIRGAGLRNLTTHDLAQLRAMHVSGAFIKSLADAGYNNLSVRDVVRLAASGVNSDFIRDLSRYRDRK